MLRAECYKQRMEKGLSFLEFNYMIMQSYDFYHLFQHYGCNMQFGGDEDVYKRQRKNSAGPAISLPVSSSTAPASSSACRSRPENPLTR